MVTMLLIIKKLTKVAEGTDNTDATNKHQLDTGLNTNIDKSQDSTVGTPEARKLVRYMPDKGLITSKLYIEDEYGDNVIIKLDDQDYDDVHLYIPNLQNYDGISNRRKSSLVVNSVDNVMTGKIILPSGNLVVKDGNNQTVLNQADLNKIYGSQSGSNGIVGNKVALYSNNGELYANTFGTKIGNNVIFLRSRNQSSWKSIYIPTMNSDANIIIDQTNQTINGNKTFSRAITMTQEGSASNHLVTKSYVDDNFMSISGMSTDLNMNNRRIINVKDYDINTSSLQDVPNIKYIQNNFIDRSSGILTGNLNASNNRIFF